MTIQDQLYSKVSAEYQVWIGEIKKLPVEQIIEKAYEINTKADLLMCFDVGEVEENEARVLLTLDSPLEHIFQQQMEADLSWYMDGLRGCIETEAKALLKEEKEIIQGYEIVERIEVGQKAFVLGHNPAAVQPYVTWVGRKDREGGYDWGHYTDTREAAQAKMQSRVTKEQRHLDAHKRKSGKGAR